MTYQEYIAMVLHLVAVECIRRQNEGSGPDLFETGYEQAQEVYTYVLSYGLPRSPFYTCPLSYKSQLFRDLSLLWPAFLWELQQAL